MWSPHDELFRGPTRAELATGLFLVLRMAVTMCHDSWRTIVRQFQLFSLLIGISLTAHFADAGPQSWLNPRAWHVAYDDHHFALQPKTRPIPRGWVIVGHRHSKLQFGGTCDRWIIQKLPLASGHRVTIWREQEIPCGWAVVEEVHSIHCPGHGRNALVIAKI